MAKTMIERRIELQSLLEGILGSKNVYYQAPESIMIKYPAIIYSRKRIENKYADDCVYLQHACYSVTVVDSNPDSEIVIKVSQIKSSTHERHFVSDGLNHDVFTIYY